MLLLDAGIEPVVRGPDWAPLLAAPAAGPAPLAVDPGRPTYALNASGTERKRDRRARTQARRSRAGTAAAGMGRA